MKSRFQQLRARKLAHSSVLNVKEVEHRAACGHPISGPILANGAGNALDLDWLYRGQIKELLRRSGMEWEGWHGFRRGFAPKPRTHRACADQIAAMILRHTNDRVTRKHYIKPALVEAIAAMRRLSEALSKVENAHKCSAE